ncbi:hypothetical protein ACFE04_030329 [Oxalis oulophora]
MATLKQLALATATLGTTSFILGIFAEHKKPASGNPMIFKDYVICKYPADESVVLGFLSVGFLTAAIVLVSLFGEGMLLWATIDELLHLSHENRRYGLGELCSTAKTGVFGGGAFLALNSTLLWLICLMLANNSRDDYFDEQVETSNTKGEIGQVLITPGDNKAKI